MAVMIYHGINCKRIVSTVGYGDIYAVSNVGKVLTMVSSLLGIAIVALPAGIVTAGYMEAVSKQDDDKS